MNQANLSETKLLEKIKNLNNDYQQLVQDFVEMLSQKQQENQLENNSNHGVSSNNDQLYGYGSLAGKIIMSDDFDEPLEDLREYM
jgi:Protein of unknown function (DUF2281)